MEINSQIAIRYLTHIILNKDKTWKETPTNPSWLSCQTQTQAKLTLNQHTNITYPFYNFNAYVHLFNNRHLATPSLSYAHMSYGGGEQTSHVDVQEIII
jgi:hypothetical protein